MTTFDDELDVELHEDAPEDRPRHFDGVQDDGEDPVHGLRSFASSTQRDTPSTLTYYEQNASLWPFDPDGMCLKVCRWARNIPSKYASAKEAQDATPAQYRVTNVADIRRGMIMYLDTVGDSNPFGHIVTVVGRVKGIDRSKLESLIVWTNSVVANKVVLVRGNYFEEHWGDRFQFAATWLNGEELKLPEVQKPVPVPTPPKPISNVRRLHLMHASLQVQDSAEQIQSDLSKIFHRARERKVAWITGTEDFGPKVHRPLEAIGEVCGFRVERPAGQDSWVAVRKSLIAGNFMVHWQKIIEGGDAHRDLGVLGVEFDTDNMGRWTVIANHLLTQRQPNATAKNLRVTHAVGDYAQVQAAGSGKVAYGGDQNLHDRNKDTFMGVPFTSIQDELKKYEPTHEHGGSNIDVIATYDADRKVKAAYIRALDDTELKLFGDHFLVEAGIDVTLS